jgi:hypothetical protein
MRIIATRAFDRAAARLLTAAERAAIEAELIARPDAWPVIRGSGGARKARVARGGQGKRGGGRVIYFHMPAPGVLVLLLLYAKNETENLTSDDLKAIRSAIAEVREAVGDDPKR